MLPRLLYWSLVDCSTKVKTKAPPPSAAAASKITENSPLSITAYNRKKETEPQYLRGRNLTVTVTFSFGLVGAASGRSTTKAWELGPGLDEVAGEADSLEVGLDDVVEEGVTGRLVVAGGGWAGEFRVRNGEIAEGLRERVDILAEREGEAKWRSRAGKKELCRLLFVVC